MQTRKLGPFTTSCIGFGCMNITGGYGRTSAAEAITVLQTAFDVGYRFFDTAALYGYGESEALVGKALKGQRQDILLASKCGLQRDKHGQRELNGRPERIKQVCEQSLKLLQTDVIDLYYLHRVDPNVPIEESVGAMADLIQAGKIRSIGLSEISSEQLKRGHKEHPITAVQSEYSLWSRTPEAAVFKVCDELDIAFVPFSPLTRGFLTGQYQDHSQFDETDLRAKMPRFSEQNLPKNLALLPEYNAIANKVGCTPAQLALAWVLAERNQSMLPIPGTKHLNYVKENALAAEVSLDEATRSQLNNLINESSVVGERYSAQQMSTTDSEQEKRRLDA